MYKETGCFDPNSMAVKPDDGFCQVLESPPPPLMAGSSTNSRTSYEDNNLKLSTDQELSFHHINNPHHQADADVSAAAMGIQLQNQQMGFNPHLMQESSNQFLALNSSTFCLQDEAFAQTPDLLNLFHLPRCSASSLLQNSSIPYTNPNHTAQLGFSNDLSMEDAASASPILYDDPQYFHLNLPSLQPPLFRDLVQSLPPHNYSLPRGSYLFGGGGDIGDDRVEGSGGASGGGTYQDGDGEQFDNGGLEFTWDNACMGKERNASKMTKQHERLRRLHLNDRFEALKDLVPNPTKNDRASVVGDAIEYIKDLLRTINKLKILVEKKSCGKRQKKKTDEEDPTVDNHEMSSSAINGTDQSLNTGSSCCIQRKSKDTEVDVRIIDDEVTIKLVQRSNINCLLLVSKVLEELQLEIHHVAGGHVGDYYSFFLNTKIYEGCSVYASAIANKLIEVMDRQYASTPSVSSCYQ